MRRTAAGLWYRPADKVILDEVRRVYNSIPIRQGDILLDIGAHIGAASCFLLERGVSRVIAVEPDPANLRLLRRNLPQDRVIAAAVGRQKGAARLHAAGSHLSTLVPGKRPAIPVAMVTLGELLTHYRPTILKVDAEFGEYDMPELRELPEHVSVLAIEVHVRYDLVYRGVIEPEETMQRRRREAAALIGAIRSQGFEGLFWREKQAKDHPIEDQTGLSPLAKSVDAVFVR